MTREYHWSIKGSCFSNESASFRSYGYLWEFFRLFVIISIWVKILPRNSIGKSFLYTYSSRHEVTHVDASARKRACGKRKSDPEIAERISSRLVIYGCGPRCVRTAATAWEILLAAKFVNLPHDVVRVPNIASYYRSLFTIETLFPNVLLFSKGSEALRFFLNLLLQHTITLCNRLHWKIDGQHEIVRKKFWFCYVREKRG